LQSRYIAEGGGGDQLCGRAATGLDINSSAFAALPPHFKLSDGDVPLTIEEWEEILPGYSTFYPAEFRHVCLYLLASLSFHSEWLKATLPERHPLFLQPVWTSGVLTRVRSKVHTGQMTNEETGLTATGVPPTIMLANTVEELKEEMARMRVSLESMIKETPNAVKDVLLEHFTIDGAVPLTKDVVMTLIGDLREHIDRQFAEQLRRQTQPEIRPTVLPSVQRRLEGGTLGVEGYRSWSWGDGTIHMVPKGWKMPLGNVQTIFSLWFTGFPSENIQPLRFLRASDLVNNDEKLSEHERLSKSRLMGSQLSKAKAVITYLVEAVSGRTIRDVANMTSPDRSAFFETAFVDLCTRLHPDLTPEQRDARKLGDAIYVTMYDRIKKLSAV
jgi:hypothetical protein